MSTITLETIVVTPDNNQSNIERAETIANWTQMIVNKIAEKYGGDVGRSFSNFLTGNGGLTTSMGDLIDKINKGTATGDDVADVLQDAGSIIAGFGVMAGYANPWTFSVLAAVGVGRGIVDYLETHPELRGEIWDVIKEPANMKEWLDIWDALDSEYDITELINNYIYHKGDLTYDPNAPIPESDIDHDGIPDWLDPDMDGDGLPDAEDSDRDGDSISDTEDSDPLTPQKPIEALEDHCLQYRRYYLRY